MTKITEFKHSQFIRVRNELYDLNEPRIMGIINLTPDSFWEGSRVREEKFLLEKVEKMVEEGADMIDLGAVSTRPGATILSSKEERERLGVSIQLVRKEIPSVIVSVDTFHAETASWAIDEGADMINDVSGGQYDEQMFDVIAQNKTPYILMHSDGQGATQLKTSNRENLINEVIRYFAQKIELLNQKGVSDIIIDPGFGFDKTIEENFLLAKQLELLHILNRPLLVGVSRKSMIYKTLQLDAESSLNGTTAMHSALFQKKCNVFRVHDVKEMAQVKELLVGLSQ